MHAIFGVPLTSATYDHAVEGAFRATQKDHKRTHANLCSQSHASKYFIQFYDNVENHIRGLAVLEQVESTNGGLLGPVILDKLPPETKKNLAHTHAVPWPEWTITDL